MIASENLFIKKLNKGTKKEAIGNEFGSDPDPFGRKKGNATS
jgi:hypothetical protein